MSGRTDTAKGPDFLCIGMQKAATDFLFDCLNGMDGFRIPIRKEFHHFGRRKGIHPGGRRLLDEVAVQLGGPAGVGQAEFFRDLEIKWYKRKSVRLSARTVKLDKVNLEFLRKFSVYVDQNGGDQAYLDLFSPFADYISGDITPAYSTLGRESITQVQGLIPKAKVILCVRDPVARLWSQFNMQARRRLAKRLGRKPISTDLSSLDELLSVKRLRNIISKDKFMKRSVATEVHDKWVDVFGQENLLVVNFEDLTGKTIRVTEKIADFFGTGRPLRKLPENRKQAALKIRIDDARREVISTALGDEIENFSRLFDNHRDRV